jgi:hypothetical protein
VTQVLNDLVFKCIDETLAEILGVTIRDAVYFKEGRRTEELPSHVNGLFAILEKNLGSEMTRVIVLTIARKVYSELRIAFTEKPNFDLVDYVEEAKSIAHDVSGPT